MRRLLHICGYFFVRLALLLGSVLRAVFGISWAPPAWLRKTGARVSLLGKKMCLYPLRSCAVGMALMLLLGGVGYAGYWYSQLPEPQTVGYVIQSPSLTDYTQQPLHPDSLQIHFHDSVAPLDAIGKNVDKGITIRPAIKGKWRWTSDRILQFIPDMDWPVNQNYTVIFDKKNIFTQQTLLKRYSFDFNTHPFEVSIQTASFYQDPTHPDMKQLVATLRFSHPVDQASLPSNISLELGSGLTYKTSRANRKDTSVIDYSDNGLEAYIHSAPLSVPIESSAITLHVTSGVKSRLGGEATTTALTQSVQVPGRDQLVINGPDINFAEQENGESNPVMVFNSSTPVAESIMASGIHAWLLPTRDDGKAWPQTELPESLLNDGNKLTLKQIPGEHEANTQHAFGFRVPPGRQILVKIDGGIEAEGGYVKAKPTYTLRTMPDYPKVLEFLSNGALLPLSGERLLGIQSRGISHIHADIARVLPGQLHHLVDASSGELSSPELPERYFERVVEREQRDISLSGKDPSKTYFDSIDLTDFLRHDGGRKGLFVIRLSERHGDISSSAEENDDDSDDNTWDERFILVTDLGMLAKLSANGDRDVYVQSISSGHPVPGASIQLIGRNGRPLATRTTDAQGHVLFTGLGDLKHERTPLMYTVSINGDFSFLPVGRDIQRLDMSRFDIGGVGQDDDADGVHSYLFSDRGLYRPGEEAHLGILTRRGDWQNGLAGLPVEFVVMDPRGATVIRQAFKVSPQGFDSADFTSSETAPAGTYQAQLMLMGKDNSRRLLGSTIFSVRDFEPDRMKVALKLSDQAVKGWIRPEDVHAVVEAKQLFGASAPGRRVESTMSLQPAFPEFAEYKGYHFQFKNRLAEPVEEKLSDVKTDDRGMAIPDLELGRFSNSTYSLHLLSQVFEAGSGRNVAADSSVMVSSAPWLVGVKSEDSLDFVARNAERKVRWQAVSPNLVPLGLNDLQTVLVEHRMVSVLIRQNDGTYKYESRRKDIDQTARAIDLAEQGTLTALDTSHPGDFSLVLKDANSNVLNQVDYHVAGNANLSGNIERNAELTVRLDKREYVPGDDIALNIRAPYTGSGLITIERDKVYAQQWFKADNTSSVQHIRLPEGVEGNAYINVQFVRDPGSKEIYMSPLSYRVIPFRISRQAHAANIDLQVPEHVEPGQTLDIHVNSQYSGRAVVFAVDEGILQVARYKTPNPLGYFFRKRALEVETNQILDLILPDFARLMAVSAPGGDTNSAIASHLNPFKRKHRPPVAWWSGMIDVPAGDTVLHYTVPDSFNGSLKLYAVMADDQRLGVATAQTNVRGPLVITPDLPLFVAPGDVFDVSATVFSNLKQTTNLQYHLETDKDVTVEKPEGVLKIAPNQEKTQHFTVRAGNQPGTSTLRWVAELPDGKRVTISDTISIRPASDYRVQVTAGSFDGKSHNIRLGRHMFPQFRKSTLSLDSSPLAWTSGLGQYLEANEYACTEQIVSRITPALELNNDHDKVQKALDRLISILRQRQIGNGAIGLWAATPDVTPFITLYTANMLMDAREEGYAIPGDMLDSANRYISAVANGNSSGIGELRDRAYAAYLLARQGVVVSGPLADIQERLRTLNEKEWKNDIAAIYLAAGYKILKLDPQADKLMEEVPWLSNHDDADNGSIYYSPLIHDATKLLLIERHFPSLRNSVPQQVMTSFGNDINELRYSTLSASLLIKALKAYSTNMSLDTQLSARSSDSEHDTNGVRLDFSGIPRTADVTFASHQLQLIKQGDGTAYYSLSESGFDDKPPPASKQGIEIQRDYLSLDGKPLTTVKEGEEFIVRLRMRIDKGERLQQIAAVDLLPGGVEPVINPPVTNSNGDNVTDDPSAGHTSLAGTNGSDWTPDFSDIRDDRVVLYGRLNQGVKTFTYRARATNAGTYITPSASITAMYDMTLQGQSGAGQLKIVVP